MGFPFGSTRAVYLRCARAGMVVRLVSGFAHLAPADWLRPLGVVADQRQGPLLTSDRSSASPSSSTSGVQFCTPSANAVRTVPVPPRRLGTRCRLSPRATSPHPLHA